MALEVGNSLYWKCGLDNSELRRGTSEALGIFRNFSRQILGIPMFATIGITAGIIFAKISKDALKMSVEFESAMKEVQSISKAVQEDFEGMSDRIYNFSLNTPESAKNLAKAYYEIASAGFDGAEGLEILAVASKSAVAGVTDTKTAVDGLTTVLNAFHLSTSEANKIADIMFKTVELGKTTFPELANSIAVVAPLAASTGIKFEEISGAIATLTKQGVPTTEAMTQIRASIISANEVLGDGWAKLMSYQNAMKLIMEKADGSQTKLRDMMGRVEGVNAVLSLTGKNARMAASDLETMNKSIGSTTKAFDIMIVSTENQTKLMWNNINAKLLRPLGDAVKFFIDATVRATNDAFSLMESSVDKLISETDKLKLQDKAKLIESYLNVVEKLKPKIILSGEEIALLKEAHKYLEGVIPGLTPNWVDQDKYIEKITKIKETLSGITQKLMIQMPEVSVVGEKPIKPFEWDAETLKELWANIPGEYEAKLLEQAKRNLAHAQKIKELWDNIPDEYTKKMEEEAKRQLKHIKEEQELWANIPIESAEKLSEYEDERKKHFDDMAEGFVMLSGLVGSYNKDLGETLRILSDVSNIMSRWSEMGEFSKFATKITLGFSIIKEIVNLFKKIPPEIDSATRTIQFMTRIIEGMDRETKKWESAIARAPGTERIDVMIDALRRYQVQLQDLIIDEEAYRIIYLKGGTSGYYDTYIKAQDERIEKEGEIFDLTKRYYELITGTTAESIADSIAEGFLQGKLSAQDFAEDFQKIMSDSLMGIFKRRIITESLESWYGIFAEQAKGGLTAEEIFSLKNSYATLISGTKLQWESIQEIAEQANINLIPSATGKTGMAGAIMGITEETASILSGQFTGMRIDTSRILGFVEVIFTDIHKIEENTRIAAYYLFDSKNYLKEIRDSTGGTLVTEKEILKSMGI